MLRLFIVDDNYDFVRILYNKINSSINKNFQIVKIISDGLELLEQIKIEKPDVILLDLNIPNINGIEVLKKIEDEGISVKTIIISGSSELITKIITNHINVYSIFTKPVNIEEIIVNLNKIYDENKNINNLIKKEVIEILNYFSFNKSSLGYFYIIDGLIICIDNKQSLIHCNKLYLEIAKKYDLTTTNNIKWNIDKAIGVMNKLTDRDKILKFFPYDPYPSTKTFINKILDIYYNG